MVSSKDPNSTRVWVVRAEFGRYTDHFLSGGYVAIGWMPDRNLSAVEHIDELYDLYREAYPDDTSKFVIGTQVGQIRRFLMEMTGGDYVITPAADTEWIHCGQIKEEESSYYHSSEDDGCPFLHRRQVEWAKKALSRSEFSVPFQNTIRSSLTVFEVSHREEILEKIGRSDLIPKNESTSYDPYGVVLDQILELDSKEFEILVGHLLTALGFEGTEVTGKPGDGGVDVIGNLNASNMANVKVFVQAKRHSRGSRVSVSDVKSLRQAIHFGGQGAFITTADYQKGALEVALETGFPRIGLINGNQLVDLLVEHWNDIPQEFHERLNLKPGLVIA